MSLPELYFFHRDDCEVCAVAKPVFQKWRMEHPEVICVELNCTHRDWRKYDFRPKQTPAYLLAVDFKPIGHIEGALTTTRLIDRFVKVAQVNARRAG